MANYAQTVNVIGAIKTSKREAVFDSTGVVLALYRLHFGTIPVEIGGAPEPLDVAAAWRENGRALTISIVNPTRQEQTIDLQLAGRVLPARARLWRVSGTDEKACNVPGKPPQVVVQETAAAPISRPADGAADERFAVRACDETIETARGQRRSGLRHVSRCHAVARPPSRSRKAASQQKRG